MKKIQYLWDVSWPVLLYLAVVALLVWAQLT